MTCETGGKADILRERERARERARERESERADTCSEHWCRACPEMQYNGAEKEDRLNMIDADRAERCRKTDEKRADGYSKNAVDLSDNAGEERDGGRNSRS